MFNDAFASSNLPWQSEAASKQQYRDLRCAIIYGGAQMQRSIISHQLKEMGVEQVRHCSAHSQVRRHLESGEVDLAVLDDSGEAKDSGLSSRALIEDMRRCGSMDLSAIVVLTSSLASRLAVTEAAESGIDTYLLQPFSHATLAQRVQMCWRRRLAMKPIYDALAQQRLDDALRDCLQRLDNKSEHWVYCARIAAEILLQRGMAAQAQTIYAALLQVEALPWARLGLGRCLHDQGKLPAAIAHLEQFIEDVPEQSDAYDLLARSSLEAGNREGAMQAYRMALKASPGSVSRLQRLGLALYYSAKGEDEEAKGAENEALSLLEESRRRHLFAASFDSGALFVLARMHHKHRRDTALMEVQRSAVHLVQHLEDVAKKSSRARTAVSSAALSSLGLARDTLLCVEVLEADCKGCKSRDALLEKLLHRSAEADFGFDAACALCTLLAILAARSEDMDAHMEHISRIGLRFGHSRLACEWLSSAAAEFDAYQRVLEGAHETAFAKAQDALRGVVTGKKEDALREVLALAQSSLNARVVEMAYKAVQRHHADVEGGASLLQQAEALYKKCDPVAARRNPNGRQLRHPGGITLLAHVLAT